MDTLLDLCESSLRRAHLCPASDADRRNGGEGPLQELPTINFCAFPCHFNVMSHIMSTLIITPRFPLPESDIFFTSYVIPWPDPHHTHIWVELSTAFLSLLLMTQEPPQKIGYTSRFVRVILAQGPFVSCFRRGPQERRGSPLQELSTISFCAFPCHFNVMSHIMSTLIITPHFPLPESDFFLPAKSFPGQILTTPTLG